MPQTDGSDFRVVCVGGSAGGLQAYIDILKSIPAETGMAFVIAPHRGIEHSDLLPAILRTKTQMPVEEVRQGMRLEPNKVFIMPPRMDMSTAENIFILHKTAAPSGWPKTINSFLFSLAKAKGDRSVAVIVSGLDSDGVAALRAIKAAGGVTFAQADPAYDSMPRHAVETGHVDYLLPAHEIGRALVGLAEEHESEPHPTLD